MEDIADDAEADTDDADEDLSIFTIVWLYYNTWMFNIYNERIHSFVKQYEMNSRMLYTKPRVDLRNDFSR
jgi:hypothetical protein